MGIKLMSDNGEDLIVVTELFKTASIDAVTRHKLYKLAWDLVGSEFAGRHMLYEKFYAGNSLVVRNQSDREAPWERFHATVDGLLERIEVPAGKS